MKKQIIFSDFDGTITEKDVIIMIMEKFASPEWVDIKNKILYERTITLKDGIEKLFSLIPSDKKEEVISYIKENVRLREGFEDFLVYCKKNNIDFKVVSGGLDFFVETVLKGHIDKKNIYTNKADFTNNSIKIKYNYLPKNCMTCGNCGCCKIEIIEQYPKDQYERIVIGDSLTDLAAAKIADKAFARADLIKYLNEEGYPYIEFETFFDIKNKLEAK